MTRAERRAQDREDRAIRYVIHYARYSAKKAVQNRIRAAGLKLREYSCKEIAALTDAYFEEHRDELLTQAAMSLRASI
jgi:hypothetical protein